MPDNVRVVLLNLPHSVHGFTVCKEDWYTVIINAQLGQSGQINACEHELAHINKNHFSCPRSSAQSAEEEL